MGNLPPEMERLDYRNDLLPIHNNHHLRWAPMKDSERDQWISDFVVQLNVCWFLMVLTLRHKHAPLVSLNTSYYDIPKISVKRKQCDYGVSLELVTVRISGFSRAVRESFFEHYRPILLDLRQEQCEEEAEQPVNQDDESDNDKNNTFSNYSEFYKILGCSQKERDDEDSGKTWFKYRKFHEKSMQIQRENRALEVDDTCFEIPYRDVLFIMKELSAYVVMEMESGFMNMRPEYLKYIFPKNRHERFSHVMNLTFEFVKEHSIVVLPAFEKGHEPCLRFCNALGDTKCVNMIRVPTFNLDFNLDVFVLEGKPPNFQDPIEPKYKGAGEKCSHMDYVLNDFFIISRY